MNRKMNRLIRIMLVAGGVSSAGFLYGQQAPDTTGSLTLGQCINYALKHQPAINRARIGMDIARATNAINRSGWLPQVYITGTLTHYDELPTSFVDSAGTGKQIRQRTGVVNTAVPSLSVTQAIFSPALAYAVRTARLITEQAQESTDSSQISLIANVSKSFYNVLLTLAQIDVLRQDTARLAKNDSDTYHQYIGGIVDETDFDEATISLNNSRAQLKQAVENVYPQYAALKQAMGFPPEQQFNVSFDTLRMMQDISFDTTQALDYAKRIEYKQLQTVRDIQHEVTGYYHSAWLPTVSAFFNYDYSFQNNSMADLFRNAYPYSYIGLSVNMPIFTGFSRIQNERRSRLEEQQLDWSQVELRSEIYSEYSSALASYKGNLYNLTVMRDNAAKAQRVYFIVDLQYKQGVVAYLNVITAESNLISSEIGYINALYQVLSSKIDLEKAMGIITY